MTTGKEAMQHLQRARPPRLDDVDSRLDWETIVAQPRGHRTSSPGRLVLGWGLAGAVPIVAAAIALVLVGGQPTTPASPEQRHSEASTPRELLLVAATNALKTKSTGRYFVTKTETGYVFSAKGYDVLGRRYAEDWEPRSAQDHPWGVGQHLGAAPFGPGSEAAWRADGSPTSWTIPGNGKNPDATTVTAAAGPRTVGGSIVVKTGSGPTNWARAFVLGGQVVSAETMATLPTDAARLRAWLTERYNADPDPLMTNQDRLIDDALQLIAQMPVTAQVRSAAYQMLAELDTVQLLPAAADQRGRTGAAVALPVRYEDGVTTLRVIFNQDSGDVLSIEQLTAAGKLRGYTLTVSSGWTDEPPPAE
ncbi:hypothetical protein [Dactylosporangium sp. CA-139066]|uniref:hypothetical protein n=1 Tax=Dactylosporangium sp. CA-139066 TaxID=3239930 RepID=UPI003D918108